jgi:sigma-B regulation protein RsbU (phosphoserine phosphatase)
MTALLAQEYAASTDMLASVRNAVRAAALEAGASEDCAEETVLAINEACMNIIQHGYRFAAGNVFRVEMSVSDATLEILLCDNGAPVCEENLQPRALDDVRPGGLGVHFIRELTDTMAYLQPSDAWRNRLQITKRIT